MNKENYNYSPLLLSCMLGLVVAPVVMADGIMARESNWYLGAAVSALWSSSDAMYVYNGAPFPYHNDVYAFDRGTGSALAVQLSHVWPTNNKWLPDYSLGLQYEHYWLGDFDGTITQYSLPQFLNYSYNWSVQSDTVSLYSKLHVVPYGALRPFVKGGIGLAINRSGSFYETALPGVTPRASAGFEKYTQNNFAYYLGAGVDYDISPKWSLSLAYNYLNLGTLRSGNGVDTWARDHLSLKNYDANMLVFGVSYSIG